MIALCLADLYPDKVKKIILIASTPCFISNDDWPGVPAELFDQFEKLRQNVRFLCADFDYLSFQNQSIDLIYSNFSLQWSLSLQQTFAELKRILQINGYLLFSILGHSSLKELKACWRKIDDDSHVNHFYSEKMIKQFLEKERFKIIEAESIMMTDYFSNVYDIMRALKAIGANYVFNNKASSLRGKKTLEKLAHHYEEYKNTRNQLPVSYEVIYRDAAKITWAT